MTRRKYKFRKPKTTARSSMTPVVWWSRESIRNLNLMHTALPERIKVGKQLVLLELAFFLRKSIQSMAPDLLLGAEETDYAKDIRIGILYGVDDEEAVSVYYEDRKVTVTEEMLEDTALYYQRRRGSPEWVNVLMKYGPWPADMVPLKIEKDDNVGVVARRARQDELVALGSRIYARRGEIENQLKAAGRDDAKIEKNKQAIGVVVREDISYNILRREFGLDGKQAQPHWRPAFRLLGEQVPKTMAKFVNFVETGNDVLFDIPDAEVDELQLKDHRRRKRFQDEIAPFVKL